MGTCCGVGACCGVGVCVGGSVGDCSGDGRKGDSSTGGISSLGDSIGNSVTGGDSGCGPCSGGGCGACSGGGCGSCCGGSSCCGEKGSVKILKVTRLHLLSLLLPTFSLSPYSCSW